MQSIVLDDNPDTPRKLNDLARYQAIVKLEQEILFDMRVCEVEGWDKMEFIKMIQELINGFCKEDDMENKQAICDALCATLKLTDNAGTGNKLKELKYIKDKEVVRPIFEDGTGENGWYDINVACDSGTAMIVDISKWIRRMW